MLNIRSSIESDTGSIGTANDSATSPHKSMRATTCSFFSSKTNVRPILVGYAFGKKKMSTMGIIMAEASKALSTIITTALLDDVDDTDAENSVIFESENKLGSSKLVPNERRTKDGDANGDVKGEKPNRKENKNLNGATLDKHYLPQKIEGKVVVTTDRLDDQLLDCDATLPSLITLNSSFSCVSASSPKASFPFNLFPATGNTTQSKGPSSISSKWSTVSDGGSYRFDHDIQNNKTNNKNAPKVIRVSFVPLDLDSPLEEQHGGKFDVILHKLTEDILSISKLAPDVVPSSMQSTHLVRKATFAHLSTLSTNEKKCHEQMLGQKNEKDKPQSSSSVLDESQLQAIARVERLNDYKKDHPCCCLVDHPADIKALMSRADMSHVLAHCLRGVTTASGIPVRNPLFFVLQDNEIHRDILDRLSHPKDTPHDNENPLPFSFPFIAKPLTAAGTSQSHKMGIVLGRSGIRHIEPPCLLQDYSNHDGVLYKVYVLGDMVQVFPRVSLPNLPEQECTDEKYAFVEFDSQRTYPTLRDFGVNSCNSREEPTLSQNKDIDNDLREKRQKRCVSENYLPSNEGPFYCKLSHIQTQNQKVQKTSKLVTADEIRPVASVIRKAFGLELFGFDILVVNNNTGSDLKSDQKEMLVVDVNYFPSYKEITAFPSLLAQYLTERAIEGRLKRFQSI